MLTYVKTNEIKSQFTDVKRIHNHEPGTAENFNLQEVRGNHKRKIPRNCFNVRPNKIIRSEFSSLITG